MHKLKISLLLLCLGIISAFPAHGAQIGGKALDDVDDVVKEATHGSLEIPKHSIMFLKAGAINKGSDSYLQTSIMTLNHASTLGMKTLQVLGNQGGINEHFIRPVNVMDLTPVLSRRSYNGKKVVMWHTTNEKSFKTYFAALQNTRTGGGGQLTTTTLHSWLTLFPHHSSEIPTRQHSRQNNSRNR